MCCHCTGAGPAAWHVAGNMHYVLRAARMTRHLYACVIIISASACSTHLPCFRRHTSPFAVLTAVCVSLVNVCAGSPSGRTAVSGRTMTRAAQSKQLLLALAARRAPRCRVGLTGHAEHTHPEDECLPNCAVTQSILQGTVQTKTCERRPLPRCRCPPAPNFLLSQCMASRSHRSARPHPVNQHCCCSLIALIVKLSSRV